MLEYDHSLIYIALICIAVCMLCLTFILLYTVITNNKHRKTLEELSKYSLHVSSTISKEIPEILDLLITDSFNDLQIKRLIPLQEGYINSTREDEIRRELVKIVTDRISQATIDKLSLFYNPENLAGIIADKIYIAVMNYVITHNKDIGEIPQV